MPKVTSRSIGVSQDASKRYSKKEVGGGQVKVVERGPRKEMLRKERELVERNPGPKNREPWAGKKREYVTKKR